MKQSTQEYESYTGIVPIPIRADTTVRIHGIPHDLTKAEADRIARVIIALAEPEDIQG